MEKISLPNPTMTTVHSHTVTNAVKAFGGSVKSVSPTRTEIELKNAFMRDAVIRAIRRAGYNVVNGISNHI